MAARGGEDLMSDEIVINKCCVCAKKNRRTEAAKYCVDCKDYFCTQCVDIHAVFPATEGHKLLDKSDLKSVRSEAGSLPSYPTQRCDEHKSEVLNMYCQDHDEVACATCIGLNHRSCRHVYSIPDNVENLYKKSEYSRVENNIKLTKSQIDTVKKTKEAQIKALKNSLKKAIDSVKTFKQELQTLLDKIEQQTVTELKKEYDRIEKSLEEEIKEAEKQMDALNKMAAQLKHAEGNKSQEFVCVKTSEKLTKMNDEKNKQHITSDETVMFTAEQSIKSYLQQLKVFGKATSTQSAVQQIKQAAKPESFTSSVAVPPTSLYKVSKQREINVKVRDDKGSCDIVGSCITDGGVLLLADSSNRKLKRVDLSTETVTDYLSLTLHPKAVCQVSKTEAAVSLDNKTVQFVTLGGKLTATRTLTFEHKCWGLAYSNGKLFISDWDKSVYICDMNGKQLRRVTKDASGKNIFQNNSHIAVSAEVDKVFVADLDKGLITLDNQGNYLSTLNKSDIHNLKLWGVCTDDKNVFVCGHGTYNIIRLSQDSKVIAPIATVGSPNNMCYSLCIDSRKSRLYVTKPFSDAICARACVRNTDIDGIVIKYKYPKEIFFNNSQVKKVTKSQ